MYTGLLMANESRGNAVKTHDEILAWIRGLTASIRDGAAAAEEARTVARETIDALVSAGIPPIPFPPRFGGYGLGLDTWFEVQGRRIARLVRRTDDPSPALHRP